MVKIKYSIFFHRILKDDKIYNNLSTKKVKNWDNTP